MRVEAEDFPAFLDLMAELEQQEGRAVKLLKVAGE